MRVVGAAHAVEAAVAAVAAAEAGGGAGEVARWAAILAASQYPTRGSFRPAVRRTGG